MAAPHAPHTPWGRTALLGVVLSAAVCLIVLAFSWPSVTLNPKDLPIAITGPAVSVQAVGTALEGQADGVFRLDEVADRDAAVEAIRTRADYGAIVLGEQPEVLTSSAASTVTNQLMAQLQAQLGYKNDMWKFWVGAKTQKFYGATGSDAYGDTFTEVAGEVGASADFGPFGVLANVQYGKGIGILSDGDQGDEKGFNYLVQGTYKFTDKLKFGLNYGRSRNQDDSAFNTVYNSDFKYNENLTGGLYYALTSSITLAGELGETRSKDYLGNEAKQYGGSVGGIIFF